MNNIDEIPFLQNVLRIDRTPDGDIGKVCVNDLCAVLNRSLLLRDGTAARKCPSLEILDAEHPKELYTTFEESVKFVQWMARGSKLLRERSRELLQTLQKARSGYSGKESSSGNEAHRSGDPPSQKIIELEYAGHKFTVRLDKDRYMVNATEMARPFDKRPAVWLKLAETIRLRQALVDSGASLELQSQVTTSRGPFGATWLEIHLGVKFAAWLSPAFAEWCSKRFESLFRNGHTTLGEEKLQQSAASGQKYGIPAPAESALPRPANYEDALALIETQQRMIRAQREFIDSNRYKYEHYKQTVEDREWFSTTMIANELGISAISLNLFLMDEGIQRRVHGEWVVEFQYRHLRDIHIYEWYNHRTRHTNKYKIDGWTPCGREYIVELWTKRNG